MAFDFKKEYREFYLPGGQPEIVTIPPMKYLAVRGEGISDFPICNKSFNLSYCGHDL